MRFQLPLMVAILIAVPMFAEADSRNFALGDTLTLIQRPLLNIPDIVTPGETLQVACQASPSAGQWEVALAFDTHWITPPLIEASYDPATLWWTLRVEVPTPPVYELYDLYTRCEDGTLIEDTSENAVRILPERRADWYFVHITDSHLPDHRFSSDGSVPSDSTEMDDLREIIRDINFLNPEFVIHTGDLVNEGELEDYLGWRQYSRSQRLLAELEVPVYLVGGNHDLGGWDDTPPPDGTARRDWWRFFGWSRLESPPSGAPARTQDYSFDYGPLHFIGMESYINYDYWRYSYYGYKSFMDEQLDWLDADLAASDAETKVLFYHKDFLNDINLNSLGADMALWGHIHYDSGDIGNHPYDLATEATCDGRRAYRVIRVSGDVLTPTASLSAGETGDEVLVAYSPENDGSEYAVAALVSNLHPMPFENCLLKFIMPADGVNPQLNDGQIMQIDERGGVKIYYVEVSMPAENWHTVVLQLDEPTDLPGTVPAYAALAPLYPNPFNPRTELRFTLAETMPIRLGVFDVSGREIAILAEGIREAGDHSLNFDGSGLPSGVYLFRLIGADGQHSTQRGVLLK